MSNIKDFIKTVKGKVICGIGVTALLVPTVMYLSVPSVESAYNAWDLAIKSGDGEKAAQRLMEIYDGKGLFGKLEDKRREEVLEIAITNLTNDINKINSDMQLATGGSISDNKNVKISSVKIQEKSYSSEYVDVVTTIQNNSSKTIRYIKLNLYFKDKNGNIVKSEWTNDSNNILPNASQPIVKMTNRNGWEKVSVEIDEIRFK